MKEDPALNAPSSATLHSLPTMSADDREAIAEQIAIRKREGLVALFFMLDAMPPGHQVDASSVAALLALAIED